MELGEREKVKKNDGSSAILHNIRCEGMAIRMCIESC
jgi:hypothetical protein